MSKHIKELIKLSKENPTLPIVTFTDTEVVASDDYSSWMGCIYRVYKDWICLTGDYNRIGEEDIRDYYADIEDLEDDAIDRQIKSLKESGDMYEAIIIYIGA